MSSFSAFDLLALSVIVVLLELNGSTFEAPDNASGVVSDSEVYNNFTFVSWIPHANQICPAMVLK